MKNLVNKYSILMGLILMFAAPGIAAYLFYQHPTWLGANKVNKGTLLNPPLASNVFSGKNKWRIVYVNTGLCGQSCLNQLEILARLRLALGRRLYQVDEWLLLDTNTSSIDPKTEHMLQEQDVHVAKLSTAETLFTALNAATARIFIVNPDGFFVLSYRLGVNPDDIYRDLKLLLNTSESQSTRQVRVDTNEAAFVSDSELKTGVAGA